MKHASTELNFFSGKIENQSQKGGKRLLRINQVITEMRESTFDEKTSELNGTNKSLFENEL